MFGGICFCLVLSEKEQPLLFFFLFPSPAHPGRKRSFQGMNLRFKPLADAVRSVQPALVAELAENAFKRISDRHREEIRRG